MSDQGDAGQWHPAGHNGPYSEPDEPTGPLPAVSGGDPTPPAFPPVSAPSGDRRAADDDAITGGVPGDSAPPGPLFPRPRQRAPFEPADPPSGPPAPVAEPTGASAEAEPRMPGAPSPAGAAEPAFGRTAQFSFPPPGPDDEGIGAGPAPSAGAPAFATDGPPHGSPADGARPSPGSETAAGPEKPYEFETSAGVGPAAEAGPEKTAGVRPPAPGEDEPPSWASTPGAWSDSSSSGEPAGAWPSAWGEDPGLGPAADAPGTGSGKDTDAPAFGADAWSAAAPGSTARGDAPAFGSDTGADTPASGAGAGTDVPAYGSASGSGTDTPAFGTGAWGEASPSTPDARSVSSDSPESWGDSPSPPSGGWRADSEPGPAAWDDPASGPDADRDTPAFGPGDDMDAPVSGAGAWDEPASSSGRHRAGPPDASPPPGGDIPPVDPYDARDAGHGYEVSDPSFGLGMPSGSPGRRAAAAGGAATGGDVPDVSSSWETPAYESAYDDRSAQGFAGTAGGGTSLDETPPPRPYGAPGGPFPGEPADGAGGARRGPAADPDHDHEFFGAGDDPANWGSIGPSGPPPQPGKPSSGNLRLPEWMREESGGVAPAGGGADSADSAGYDYDYGYDDEDGKSRLPLIAGLGVLVAGLVVAAGVYLLKSGGGDQQRPAAHVTTAPNRTDGVAAPNGGASAAGRSQKALPVFSGPHTVSVGRIVDQRAGLSYPKLGRPWQPQPKNGQMTELGFSEGQYALSEKAGGQAKVWARLMSGPLGHADKGAYQGGSTVQAAATQVAATYEKKLYDFKHHRKLIASQPLDVGGLKGWLVGYHLTYHRPATKATGDLYTVAVVDTGKRGPGVLLMSVPDTQRRLYPDVDYVVQSLEVG